MKNVKTLLNDKKTRKIEKRLILKERIIINTNEILILFEKTEITTQNKKKTNRLYERLKKNIIIESIMILKENKNENEIFEDDNNDEKELEL